MEKSFRSDKYQINERMIFMADLIERKKMTAVGIKKLECEIEKLNEDLKKLRKNKASAYTQTGDTWHDNPYFNQLEREEGQLLIQIAELQATLEKAEIIDSKVINKDEIAIGSIFQCSCLYEDDDEPEYEIYEIVGHGETDIENGKINYESPVAKNLLGHRVGDVINFETPAGKVSYNIIKIYESWEAAKSDI